MHRLKSWNCNGKGEHDLLEKLWKMRISNNYLNFTLFLLIAVIFLLHVQMQRWHIIWKIEAPMKHKEIYKMEDWQCQYTNRTSSRGCVSWGKCTNFQNSKTVRCLCWGIVGEGRKATLQEFIVLDNPLISIELWKLLINEVFKHRKKVTLYHDCEP